MILVNPSHLPDRAFYSPSVEPSVPISERPLAIMFGNAWQELRDAEYTPEYPRMRDSFVRILASNAVGLAQECGTPYVRSLLADTRTIGARIDTVNGVVIGPEEIILSGSIYPHRRLPFGRSRTLELPMRITIPASPLAQPQQ